MREVKGDFGSVDLSTHDTNDHGSWQRRIPLVAVVTFRLSCSDDSALRRGIDLPAIGCDFDADDETRDE